MRVRARYIVVLWMLLWSHHSIMAQSQELLDAYMSARGAVKIEKGLEFCASIEDQPEKQLEFVLELIKTAEKTVPKSLLLAKTYRAAGDAYYYMNQLDLSSEFLLQAIRTVEAIGTEDQQILGGLYNDLGYNYQEQNKIVEGQNALNKAILILSEGSFPNILADAKSNLATLYHKQGRMEEAISLFNEVFEIDKKHGDPVKQSSSLNSLGRIYVDWGKYKTGLDYYFKSVQLLDTLKNKEILAIRYNNIGMTYQLTENHKEAIRWIEKARAIEERSGKTPKLGIRYFNLGNSYAALKDYAKAAHFLKMANTIFSDHSLTQERSRVEAALGQLYFVQGKNVKALEHYLQAELFAQSSGNLPEKSNIYNKLYHYHKKTGSFENALKYFDLYVSTKDSIYNLNAARQIEELEIQYQTAQKELEISNLETKNKLSEKEVSFRKRERNIATLGFFILAILLMILFKLFKTVKKQKSELSSQNKELGRLNGIQNQIFSIISHDFRSITSSYLASARIIEHYLNKGQPEKLVPIASEIGKNSKNLSSMLENLLQWAVIKRKGVLPDKKMMHIRSSFDQVVEILEPQIQSKNNSVEIQAADETAFCDPESLQIILRNIIGNANKFTQGGVIRLEAVTTAGTTVIRISDTGLGMPEDTLKTLFLFGKEKTRQGTAGEKGTGIGLLLVSEHVNENNGSIQVNSEPGKGTCFEITLPNSPS